jgi:hypothetical protein
MASLSDLDTSSESEYDSSQDSTSEIGEDPDETLEPERDAPDSEDFENCMLLNCMLMNCMLSN